MITALAVLVLFGLFLIAIFVSVSWALILLGMINAYNAAHDPSPKNNMLTLAYLALGLLFRQWGF